MEHIKVTNKARKPVSFMALGHSVRLGPGESVQLPGYCQEAPELKKLCLREYLLIIPEKQEEKKAEAKEKEIKKTLEPGSSPGKSVKSKKKKTKETDSDEKPSSLTIRGGVK